MGWESGHRREHWWRLGGAAGRYPRTCALPGGQPTSAANAGVHTFVFADLAGYTALTEAHGDEHAAEVAAAFFAAVRLLLPEYRAEEVKTIGDALLVRVADPSEAVHLAARLVSDFGARHRSLGVRVGMHTGTAVERDGDWFGTAVNLAARVADAARAGEVLMTSSTQRAAGGAVPPGQFRTRGRRAFRNVSEPVDLVALALDESSGVRQLPLDLSAGWRLTPISRRSDGFTAASSTTSVLWPALGRSRPTRGAIRGVGEDGTRSWFQTWLVTMRSALSGAVTPKVA
jgi:class 3 adenylate cyclase